MSYSVLESLGSLVFAGGEIDIEYLCVKDKIEFFYKNHNLKSIIFDKSLGCWIVSLNVHQHFVITEDFLKKYSTIINLFDKKIYNFYGFLFGINQGKYVYHITNIQKSV